MAGDAGHLCNCRILRGRHERAKTTLTMDHTLMQHDHDQAVTRDNDYDIVSELRAYFLIINDTGCVCGF